MVGAARSGRNAHGRCAGPDLVDVVRAAVVGLTPAEATNPEIVVTRFSAVAEVLGPAALFYPTAPLRVAPGDDQCERVGLDELDLLLREAEAEEAGESGLSEITAPAFVAREGPVVVAACGWQAWPGGVAHMCVLTRKTHRGRGLAKKVAGQAICGAMSQGLLPQWRARPSASQHVARSLGLVHLGSQLSLRLG